MTYISTRGAAAPQSFIDVLMAGLAPDGGLFVPQSWPRLDMEALAGKSYTEVAEAVLYPFMDRQISREELRGILQSTYTPEIFGSARVAPLRSLEDGIQLMELFHGPTLAFKDVALQFLGRLFDHVLETTGQRMTIVGATSGDTGSAAIEACRGRKNITVYILHPHGRTSEVQRRQMTTVLDDNIHNLAIEGTFDDCQDFVKQAFADPDLKKLNLSAINSINWARIIAQSVYYVAACLELGGRPNFAVPTGNFGNIYAAYVASRMGAPVGELVIGSNRNDILTRFFETGSMALEEVVPSFSPSMDIQISSNFERYLWDLLGHQPDKVRSIMEGLRQTGRYDVSPQEHSAACARFHAFRCPDDKTLATIGDVHRKTGVVIDPHTAVGVHAAREARKQGRVPAESVTVALACAHPAKFPDAVEKASGIRPVLPEALADLMTRPERLSVLPKDFVALKQHILKTV